jgi:hypothetical protein
MSPQASPDFPRHPKVLFRFALTLTRVFAVVLMLAAPSLAGNFTVFGPQTYPRSTGEPIPFSGTFSVLNPSTQYFLQVQVAGVASAVISVNGVTVVFTSDFDMNETFVERPVVLQASNVLSGEVRGKPDGTITVTIIGIDNDPPTITATASPPANASGWNNADVTVTFTADDAISGVASITPPATLTSEGANQTVTGTATDHAGNSASASVTVNIDKTLPSVQVSYPADGAFSNASSLTVMGSAADALSGIETITCNGTPASFSGTEFSCAVSLDEGSNSIMVEATDRAGNYSSSVVTITLDTEPPSLRITSPANGAIFSASPITVTGTATDALSEIASVTCNSSPALVSGSDFTCDVGLVEGSNPIVVQATDQAGNVASQSVTVTLSTMPTPPPNAILITPDTLALVVDEPRQLALVDDYGRPVTGASWSVSDPSVAELSTSDLIILTGKAVGTVTITAFYQNLTTQATATVFAGPKLPQGTVRWSVQPTPGYWTTDIVQAQPAMDMPDIFSIEDNWSGAYVVRALTIDGRQSWRASLGTGASAAASASDAPAQAAASMSGSLYLQNTYPDSFGGILVSFYDYEGPRSLVVRLDGATGAQSWQYSSPGNLSPDWAIHPDGTIYSVEFTSSGSSPNTAVVAIDGHTGAVRFRVPLPTSQYAYLNWGCSGYNEVHPITAMAGAPMVGPNGSVYLEVQVDNWTLEGVLVSGSCTTHWLSDNILRLLEIHPDGSTTWQDVKSFTHDGPDPIWWLPHATAGQTIPDGEGGVLAGWSYSTWNGEASEARVTRLAGTGVTEYSLPLKGWGPASWCSGCWYDQYASRTMALGENGVAFAIRSWWAPEPDLDTAKVVAFDLSTGTLRWAWNSGTIWMDMVAATAGNGLVAKVLQDDGTELIARLDANGQASYDDWTANYSSLQYAYGDTWLAQGSVQGISANPIVLSASVWVTPAGYQESRASAARCAPLDPTAKGRIEQAYSDLHDFLLYTTCPFCINSIFTPLKTSQAAFTAYLGEGHQFCDGARSKEPKSTFRLAGGGAVAEYFAANKGKLDALTVPESHPLWVFFDPEKISATEPNYNKAMLFHEGLHGMGFIDSSLFRTGLCWLLPEPDLTQCVLGDTIKITFWIRDNVFPLP